MIKKLLAFTCLTLSIGANSATPVVSDGQLMGATDVDVGGAFYDVSFLEGSCNSLYSGCSNFTFNTTTSAALASQALLDQVFIGVYDSSPALTNGVTDTPSWVLTPAETTNSGLVAGRYVVNKAGVEQDTVQSFSISPTTDSTTSTRLVYAVWSLSPVPPPDSDGDGVSDEDDFFPGISLDGRWDVDGDGIPNECDPACATAGMSADLDDDGDAYIDDVDNCPLISNSDQIDSDGDGRGDACTGLPPGC
jgi:hypothetical protein